MLKHLDWVLPATGSWQTDLCMCSKAQSTLHYFFFVLGALLPQIHILFLLDSFLHIINLVILGGFNLKSVRKNYINT